MTFVFEIAHKFYFHFSSKGYDCDDLSAECKRFVDLDPTSCTPKHPSHYFMKYGCMKSCNRCKRKVEPFLFNNHTFTETNFYLVEESLCGLSHFKAKLMKATSISLCTDTYLLATSLQ